MVPKGSSPEVLGLPSPLSLSLQGKAGLPAPWTWLSIFRVSTVPSPGLPDLLLSSLHFYAQPRRNPQGSSGPPSGPPSGWIISASTASAITFQTGAAVSCFGTAHTWPCAPQGSKSQASCPPPHLSSIIPQVFVKVAPTGARPWALTACWRGNNATPITQRIPGGSFLEQMVWVRRQTRGLQGKGYEGPF